MKWTSDLPTQSGFYWEKFQNFKANLVLVLLPNATPYNAVEPEVFFPLSTQSVPLSDFHSRVGYKWYGPLTEPETE